MGSNDLGKIVRRPRLSEEVCNAIEKSIASGELLAGQQLPPEKILAETFGVSRAVAHEALALLKASGRVEMQAGACTVIAQPPKPLNFHFRQDDAHALVELHDIFELRASIELSIADLAARRRTSADIATMQAHLETIETALQAGADGSAAEDAFYRAMTAATRNACTSRLFEFIGQSFSDSRRIAWRAPERDSVQLRARHGEHRALFAAIRDGDSVRARRAAHEHLHRSAYRAGIDLANLQGSKASAGD